MSEGALAGRVALVTGAARGIGREIALALAGAGAIVVAHDRDGAAVGALCDEAGGRGGEAHPLVADLADPDAPRVMARALASDGRAPDILVLCASIEIRQTFEQLTDAALAAQSEINLHATARLLSLFVPGMASRGFGRIIAIGSVQETRANADCLYYAATKAAQTSMILTLARTLRAGDVTANVIQPGAILTDRNRAILADPARHELALSRIPLGRIGAPQDVAGLALLLCSPQGAYINGARLAVDGGMGL